RCVDPACARSCPGQAIQGHETGAVLPARVGKCTGCQTCSTACRYGIPKCDTEQNLMYQCGLCRDRTKDGIPRLRASVCPPNTIERLTDEESAQRKERYYRDNDTRGTSMPPHLEGESNVKVNLPGILQGVEKLF